MTASAPTPPSLQSQADPYADLELVYAEETSHRRVRELAKRPRPNNQSDPGASWEEKTA